MSDKKKLKVKIFNKEYSLLVENEEIAKELAVYVNNVIEDTKKDLPGQSGETLAVIAALNIAFDLFTEKSKNREFRDLASEKIKNIKLLLDETHSLPMPS